MAVHAHISDHRLTRRFIAETGTSPFGWLLHHHTPLIQELLEGTDLPLKRAATRSGLSTPPEGASTMS